MTSRAARPRRVRAADTGVTLVPECRMSGSDARGGIASSASGSAWRMSAIRSSASSRPMREPHRAGRDPGRGQRRVVELPVRGGRDVADDRVDAAEAGRDLCRPASASASWKPASRPPRGVIVRIAPYRVPVRAGSRTACRRGRAAGGRRGRGSRSARPSGGRPAPRRRRARSRSAGPPAAAASPGRGAAGTPHPARGCRRGRSAPARTRRDQRRRRRRRRHRSRRSARRGTSSPSARRGRRPSATAGRPAAARRCCRRRAGRRRHGRSPRGRRGR